MLTSCQKKTLGKSNSNPRNYKLTIAWMYLFLVFTWFYKCSMKIYRNKRDHCRPNVHVLIIIPNAVHQQVISK